MKKITKHGKIRIEERLGKEFNNKNLLKAVFKYGYPKEFFSPEFYRYLNNKSKKGSHIKVYNGFVFIISKSKNTLITTYPIPERFLPIENHLINPGKSKLLYFPYNFMNKDVSIILKDKQIINGRIKYFLGNNITEEIVLDSHIYINVDLIDNIFIDFENVTQELANIFC